MDELTQDERRAIRSLERVAKTWPKSLLLFAGGTGLTVRKPVPGKFYDDSFVVADIPGIPCDGGDGGVEYCPDDAQGSGEVTK